MAETNDVTTLPGGVESNNPRACGQTLATSLMTFTTDAFATGMNNSFDLFQNGHLGELSIESGLHYHIGQYNSNTRYLFVSLDTSFLPSKETIVEPFARLFRALRRWRCEEIFLLAWLVHVCLIWTLRALES